MGIKNKSNESFFSCVVMRLGLKYGNMSSLQYFRHSLFRVMDVMFVQTFLRFI